MGNNCVHCCKVERPGKGLYCEDCRFVLWRDRFLSGLRQMEECCPELVEDCRQALAWIETRDDEISKLKDEVKDLGNDIEELENM